MTDKEQFLRDVLTIGLETGISYWAKVRRIEREDLDVLSFECRDAEDPDASWTKVDTESAFNAIEAIICGQIEISPQLALNLAEAFYELDAGQVDAELADVVVQVAAFGEIVFG